MTRDEAIRILQSMKSDFPLPKAAQTRRAQNDALDVAIEALKAEPCEDDFEESIHKMFDHIWDCEIDHPMFQDTVGELMTAVLQAYNKARPKPCEDAISRRAAIDALDKRFDSIPMEQITEILLLRKDLRNLPSVQPEQDREFIKLTVRNSNGRPYYSIIYLEVDNNGVGHDFEGYSSYSLDVISDYLKKYFMSSAQPEKHTENVRKCTRADLIDKQAAIDALKGISFSHYFECGEYLSEDAREIEIINRNKALEAIKALLSAQPKTEG